MAKKETTKTSAATVAAKAAAKVAAGVLKLNPELKEVYVTSDGTAFYTRNDAQNHANTLTNREVYCTKRGATAEDEDSTETTTESPEATEATEAGDSDGAENNEPDKTEE